MPNYYVSKSLSRQTSPIYIQYQDSWSTILPNGETSTFPGAMSDDVAEGVEEVDSSEARRLMWEHRLVPEGEADLASRRSTRAKVSMVLWVLLACGILAVFVWGVQSYTEREARKALEELQRTLESIRFGMTYDQVAETLGGDGELMPRSPAETDTADEYWWGYEDGVIMVWFSNGHVVSKDHMGYP